MKKKKRGFGLQLETREGTEGNYLFIKTQNGSYHAFLEVETKEALVDCGAISRKRKTWHYTRKASRKFLGF